MRHHRLTSLLLIAGALSATPAAAAHAAQPEINRRAECAGRPTMPCHWVPRDRMTTSMQTDRLVRIPAVGRPYDACPAACFQP